jgi:hypothetical protein
VTLRIAESTAWSRLTTEEQRSRLQLHSNQHSLGTPPATVALSPVPPVFHATRRVKQTDGDGKRELERAERELQKEAEREK